MKPLKSDDDKNYKTHWKMKYLSQIETQHNMTHD